MAKVVEGSLRQLQSTGAGVLRGTGAGGGERLTRENFLGSWRIPRVLAWVMLMLSREPRRIAGLPGGV